MRIAAKAWDGMKYWDMASQLHENGRKTFPSGEEGYKGALFLRSFFEQHGCDVIPQAHPLHNRLRVGYEINCQWLMQYARKLLTASSITGFEQRAKRLADSNEYLSINNEIEVALKLKLADIAVSFQPITQIPAPDILSNVGDEPINVEVTSLNPPDEETHVQTLFNQILTISAYKRVASGGFVSGVPPPSNINQFIDLLNKSIDRAKEQHKVEKVNIPRVATIYVAPEDMIERIPEDSRNRYRFYTPPHRSVEEQIRRELRDKNGQLSSQSHMGLLFIYTQMTDRQTLLQMFESDMDDVEVAMASYSNLLGIVLTVPHRGIHVISNVKTEDLKKDFKGNKVFVELEAGVYQYESSLIWKNAHADRTFPDEILAALENYSSNLDNLAPI